MIPFLDKRPGTVTCTHHKVEKNYVWMQFAIPHGGAEIRITAYHGVDNSPLDGMYASELIVVIMNHDKTERTVTGKIFPEMWAERIDKDAVAGNGWVHATSETIQKAIAWIDEENKRLESNG